MGVVDLGGIANYSLNYRVKEIIKMLIGYVTY